MKRKMSRKGMISLAVSEGLVDTAYLDNADPPVWTAGIGHTKAAGDPDPVSLRGRKLTTERIMEIFESDLPDYEAIVNRNVKVPLSQQQFDALVHFAYNIGERNFRRSKLLTNLNAGDYIQAGQKGFHGWLKPKSLRNRRDKEREMFLWGKYGSTVAPFYTANFAGKTIRVGSVDLAFAWPEEKDRDDPSCTCTS